MTKLDRWFRSIKDFYKVNEILAQNKVNWKTIWEEYDTSTASGEFFLNMSLSLGQMEAKRTAERINSVFEYKYNSQKTVCTGSPPFGYKISADKKYIVDEQEAECVRKLFNNYIETNCKAETIRWYQTNVKMISHRTIAKYLTNTAYIGQFKRYGTDEIIEGYIPPILDKTTFYKVQEMFKRNIKQRSGRKNESAYIFNGLVYCHTCGLKLNGNCNTTTQKHYYRCPRGVHGLICDNKYSFPETYIEKYLIENILIKLDSKIIEFEKIQKKGEDKNSNLDRYKRKLLKLKDLYLDDLIDKDTYKSEYEKYKSLIEKIQKKDQQPDPIDYKQIKKMLENSLNNLYFSLSNEEKRRLWSSIITKIVIKNKGIYDITIG